MSSHHYKFAEHENFCSAIKNGFLPTVQDHLNKPGSEVNMNVDAGRNALHIATEAQRTNIMHYLLRNGANPMAEDDTGETPLYIAISSGNKEIVQILLDYTIIQRFRSLQAQRSSRFDAKAWLLFKMEQGTVKKTIQMIDERLYGMLRSILNGADPTGRSPDDEPYVEITKDNPEIQNMIKKAIKEW